MARSNSSVVELERHFYPDRWSRFFGLKNEVVTRSPHKLDSGGGLQAAPPPIL